MQTVHPVDAVIANVVRLVEVFREKRQSVVLVHVGWSADQGDALKSRTQAPPPAGKRSDDFSEFVDALNADPSRDILIHKRQ